MNNKKFLLIFLFVFLSVFFLANCSQPEINPTPETPAAPLLLPTLTVDNFPRIDGSTSTFPLSATIVCEMFSVPCHWMEWIDGSKHLAPLLGADTELPEYIHNGTHGAYVNLIEGRADLILVARSPSSDEVELAQRERVQLDVRPVALDAFVFILNEDNPIENLTIDHLRAIYTGELVNWRDVGGEEAEIHPYQRNENSGSQELMKSLVMKDLLILDVPPMVLPKMIAPFYAVSDDPLGIGYSVYYYEQNMAPNERVKLCAVEGIDPHPQSISSKAYPFTTEVYVVIREDLSPESSAYRMRDWLLSSEGQVVVEESGYVPLK